MDEKITSTDRINLKKMMDENGNYEDNTAHIRKVKHSEKIRDDVRKMNYIKKQYSHILDTEPSKYLEICQTECSFMFNQYTDLFNRLMKDELDLTTMTQLLTVLKLIEDEQIDQADGSIMVGKILKKLYLDSAIKRSENLDRENPTENHEIIREPTENISWKEYKISRKA